MYTLTISGKRNKETRFQKSIYYADRKTHELKPVMKGGKDENLSTCLPVLTGKETLTVYEWDGKKKQIKDCKKTVTTMKEWIDKKLDNRLFSLSMQDIFQTGTPDLWLSFWNNHVLILHQENGQVYGLYSGCFEDNNQVDRKGIFKVEVRKKGRLQKMQYYKVRYPEGKDKSFENAVFGEAAEEKNLKYYKRFQREI